MVNLRMANFKEWDSFTLQVEIIILVNLNSTKKMEEGYISGRENSQIFIKENLLKEREMEEEHFGGLMVVGMKGSLEMEFKAGMEFYIEKEVILSIKDHGIMECLMEKALNSFRMDKNIKVLLNRINSTEMESSIKMIQLFMEFGKITNFL